MHHAARRPAKMSSCRRARVGLRKKLAGPSSVIMDASPASGTPEDLGVDFQMSFRALSAAAAHADIGARTPLSLVRHFAAETKQKLQNVALDDPRALSSVGQRFVYNVVRRRLALQRQLEDSAARPHRRSRRAAVTRPRKPRGADGMRLYNDAREWTHFVLFHVHVLRVRRRVGHIGVL